jgi:cellulose synthase/poly-beta-1,6-N-acetylglucosamine synthase-like glycosyltransferase
LAKTFILANYYLRIMGFGGGGVVGAVFVVFVITQAAYLLINLLALVVIYSRPKHAVPDEEPNEYRHVNVLIPVYQEPREIIEGTLANIYATEYPRDHLSVYLIYEADDTGVTEYLDTLRRTAQRNGTHFQPIPVDRDAFVWDRPAASWLTADRDDPLPRTKAAALRYGFRTGAFLPEDIITVFDADTHVPPDFFHLGVRGLEEYDIVQAKQTVRNRGNGWLPRLEAMGIAAWSHGVYTRTTTGPYQLLGKGYFTTAAKLHALDDWQPPAITEDMRLGLDAYTEGYSLGIIDRYVRDLCPPTFTTWVRQKTRWVAGPYRTRADVALSLRDSLRFLFYTVVNQSVAVVNVVGVPAGLLMIGLTVAGMAPAFPLWLAVIVTANLIAWAYYSAVSYAATAEAIAFPSRRAQLRYFIVSNPITQAIYATFWTVPILNLLSYRLRRASVGFPVTTKTEPEND